MENQFINQILFFVDLNLTSQIRETPSDNIFLLIFEGLFQNIAT